MTRISTEFLLKLDRKKGKKEISSLFSFLNSTKSIDLVSLNREYVLLKPTDCSYLSQNEYQKIKPLDL